MQAITFDRGLLCRHAIDLWRAFGKLFMQDMLAEAQLECGGMEQDEVVKMWPWIRLKCKDRR